MDRKGASLDKKKVRNWAPKFLEKKGAKLDKKGAKSETSQKLRQRPCPKCSFDLACTRTAQGICLSVGVWPPYFN